MESQNKIFQFKENHKRRGLLSSSNSALCLIVWGSWDYTYVIATTELESNIQFCLPLLTTVQARPLAIKITNIKLAKFSWLRNGLVASGFASDISSAYFKIQVDVYMI